MFSRSSLFNEIKYQSQNSNRYLSSGNEQLSDLKYGKVSDVTLDSLAEAFELLDFQSNEFPEYDVEYANGVLTVKFGHAHGTYVINKQSPNKQIWLSSPLSGPKRYDFLDNRWIYKHDSSCLHDLLSKEISEILKRPVSFGDCDYT
ncbi:DgyrCDS5740 [Dimorphilus gyrociliatus]|uniref:ferroxidase n=1 Tax=Dimorphilus gyrociliatus TaxID=2664684 RepID=A0A7I8VMF7_9ANNE|nr:DgyrCDS5740 [Dimorphilus gyrociliatus]